MLRIQRIYAYQPRSGETGVFLDRLYTCSARAVSARRLQGTHGATGLAEGSDAERRTAPHPDTAAEAMKKVHPDTIDTFKSQ